MKYLLQITELNLLTILQFIQRLMDLKSVELFFFSRLLSMRKNWEALRKFGNCFFFFTKTFYLLLYHLINKLLYLYGR